MDRRDRQVRDQPVEEPGYAYRTERACWWLCPSIEIVPASRSRYIDRVTVRLVVVALWLIAMAALVAIIRLPGSAFDIYVKDRYFVMPKPYLIGFVIALVFVAGWFGHRLIDAFWRSS